MAKGRKHTPEQIVRLLPQVEVAPSSNWCVKRPDGEPRLTLPRCLY